MTGPIGTRRPERHRPIIADWPLLVGLVVLWLCLWSSISPLTILTGVITAVVVVRVFELPHVVLSGRVNLAWSALVIGLFLAEVVAASVQVAWRAVRSLPPGTAPVSSIVAVPLRVHGDLLLTLTAVVVSLIPGSIVVDADGGTLTLHVLGATSAADADRAIASVHAWERRLAMAIGDPADMAAVR